MNPPATGPTRDARREQLRRSRAASRGVLALGTAGALGASAVLALTVVPDTSQQQQGPTTPTGVGRGDQLSPGSDDGWGDDDTPGSVQGWALPGQGVGPGTGGSPQGTSKGS